jgi:phage tail-like protein
MTVVRDDPYSANNFEVVIQGVLDDGRALQGSFSEVSGLEVEITPIEYRVGSEATTVRKIPGLVKYSNITLKRGVMGSDTVYKWLKSATNGPVQRVSGTITLLDENRQAVMTWRFLHAWPCKWSGPHLSATANEVAFETLEICHEGLELE